MEWKTITSDNLKELVEFDQQVHPKQDWVIPAEYKFWIKQGLKIFVLVNDDRIIGCYQILEKGNEIVFHGFGVIPEMRNQGYGQHLMDKIIQDYHNKTIACKTRPNNTAMKKLLDNNQFINKMDEIVEGGEYWSWWIRQPGY